MMGCMYVTVSLCFVDRTDRIQHFFWSKYKCRNQTPTWLRRLSAHSQTTLCTCTQRSGPIALHSSLKSMWWSSAEKWQLFMTFFSNIHRLGEKGELQISFLVDLTNPKATCVCIFCAVACSLQIWRRGYKRGKKSFHLYKCCCLW